MEDDWIEDRIALMQKEKLISDDLANQLKQAYPDKIRKEVYVVQDAPISGKTVENTLMDTGLGINNAHIYKLGEWA